MGYLSTLDFRLGLIESDRMFGPELELLSNLPDSLISLKLGFFRFRGMKLTAGDHQSAVSFVATLCRMLITKTHGQIGSITLDNIKLPSDIEEYIVLIFGQNNKLHIEDLQYCLLFND